MTIIHKIPVAKRPSYPVTLNTGHPLATNLVRAWLFNDVGKVVQEYVRGDHATLDDTSLLNRWVTDERGITYDFLSTDDKEFDFTEVSFSDTTKWSAAFGIDRINDGNGEFRSGMIGATGFDGRGIAVRLTDFVQVWNDNGLDMGIDAGESHEGYSDFCLGSNGGGAGSIICTVWKNGRGGWTNSGNSGNFVVNMFGKARTRSVDFLSGRVYYFYLYENRQLSQGEAQALHQNPYQIFNGPPQYIGIDLPAANIFGVIPKKIPVTSRIQLPSSDAQINWGHPLAQGLKHVWLLNEGGGDTLVDIVGGLNATPTTGAASWGTDQRGHVNRMSEDEWTHTSYSFSDSEPWSIALGVDRINDAEFHEIVVGDQGVSDSETIGLQRNIDTNRVYVALSFTANYTDTDILPEGYHDWLFTGNGLGDATPNQYICYDGRRFETSGTAFSGWSANTIGAGWSNGRRLSGNIYYYYVYGRLLNEAEAQALHDNPYQIFQPHTLFMPIGSVAAAGGLSIPVAMQQYRHRHNLSLGG